jgi:hypothetical protein
MFIGKTVSGRLPGLMPAVAYGAARIGARWRVRREIWFYGPFATLAEIAELEKFVANNTVKRGTGDRADRVWADDIGVRVELMPLQNFIRLFHAHTTRSRRPDLVIGHDLLPLFGALAVRAGMGREIVTRNPDGRATRWRAKANTWSLGLPGDTDPETGVSAPHRFRSRIEIEHVRPEVNLFRFMPTESKQRHHRGDFLSTKALGYGLTGDELSFADAVAELLPDGGDRIRSIADDGPADLRARGRALVLLAQTLVGWFDLLHPGLSRGHGGPMSECNVFSPGSIARFYMTLAGLAPAPQFDDGAIGLCSEANLGALCHVNLIGSIPIVETDFRRQYAVIHARQGIGALQSARRLQLVEATEEVRQLAASLTEQELGPAFNAVCLVRLVSQPFLTRALYRPRPTDREANASDFGLAVTDRTTDEPVPAYLGHVVASRMLDEHSRVPEIVKAWKIVPDGDLRPLWPVAFMGHTIDPAMTPIPLAFVEEGARLERGEGRYGQIPEALRAFLVTGLKAAGNIAAYGELLRADQKAPGCGLAEEVRLLHSGMFLRGEASLRADTAAPEDDGPFTCMPLGGLVAASGAMLVGSVHTKVRDRGGLVASSDTDSGHICASKEGGDYWLQPITGARGGGVRGTAWRGQRVHLLSWREVNEICDEYETLNPFRGAYPGSILRVTKVNFDEASGERIQLTGHYRAPKRYSLEGHDGELTETMASGIGPYLSPIAGDADYVAEAWRFLNARLAGGLPPKADWLSTPLVRALTISTPQIRDELKAALPLYPGASYLAGQVINDDEPNALPKAVVANFCDDRARWADLDWCYPDGSPVEHLGKGAKLVTWRRHLEAHSRSPIFSMLGPDNQIAGPGTRGLLTRRHMRDGRRYLALKEAVTFGEAPVDAFDTSVGELFAADPDAPRQSLFAEVGVPALHAMGATAVARALKVPQRTTENWLYGNRRPKDPAKAMLRIAEAAYSLGLILTHADPSEPAERCRRIPERVRISQAFAGTATAALVERCGTPLVARGMERSEQMVRRYARLADDEPWPAHSMGQVISRLALLCRSEADANDFRLNATEPGPLGERQVILAWLGWIDPDRFPGDKGPVMPDGARIYREMTAFVEGRVGRREAAPGPAKDVSGWVLAPEPLDPAPARHTDCWQGYRYRARRTAEN